MDDFASASIKKVLHIFHFGKSTLNVVMAALFIS